VSCGHQKENSRYIYSLPQNQGSQVNQAFVLGEGDLIQIYVWRHEDLQREVMIDPSGFIYVPIAGEVKASGLTIPELEQHLSDKLVKYIRDPRVDINVKTIISRKIHVLGEVQSPGMLVLNQQTIALEAISKSGGFTNDSNTGKVLLIRQSSDESYKALLLNLDFASAADNAVLSYNIVMQNKDIIFVPPKRIASMERMMNRFQNILEPILTIEQIAILSTTLKDAFEGVNDTNSINVITN